MEMFNVTSYNTDKTYKDETPVTYVMTLMQGI